MRPHFITVHMNICNNLLSVNTIIMQLVIMYVKLYLKCYDCDIACFYWLFFYRKNNKIKCNYITNNCRWQGKASQSAIVTEVLLTVQSGDNHVFWLWGSELWPGSITNALSAVTPGRGDLITLQHSVQNGDRGAINGHLQGDNTSYFSVFWQV